VVESNLRQFHGLLLDGRERLHLLTTDNYRLIELDLPGYHPNEMDFKIIFDPLYKTAVYSNDHLIRAVALDADYRPIADHDHLMSRAVPSLARQVGDLIFPFRLSLRSEQSLMLVPRLRLSPSFFNGFLLVGLLASLVYYGIFHLRHQRRPALWPLAGVFVTGLYGLIAALIILDDKNG
jgi:hypothetical protein